VCLSKLWHLSLAAGGSWGVHNSQERLFLLLWVFVLHDDFVYTTISASAATGYDSATVQRTIDEWTAV